MTISTAAARVLTTGVLDVDSAHTLLEQVVHQKGREYSDSFTTYFYGLDSAEYASTPVDLIGHVVDLLGKNAFDLRDLDDPDASPIAINGTWVSSLGIDGIEIPDDTRRMLYEAQTAEQAGGDWGKQLDAATHYRDNARGYELVYATAA